jgi:hypothetical protein
MKERARKTRWYDTIAVDCQPQPSVRLAVVKVGRNVKQFSPFKCPLYSSEGTQKTPVLPFRNVTPRGKGVPCMRRTRQEISQIKWINDVPFGEMDLPSLVPDRGERGEIGISFGSRQFRGRVLVPREATHAACGLACTFGDRAVGEQLCTSFGQHNCLFFLESGPASHSL